jgi:hypothetical protein
VRPRRRPLAVSGTPWRDRPGTSRSLLKKGLV